MTKNQEGELTGFMSDALKEQDNAITETIIMPPNKYYVTDSGEVFTETIPTETGKKAAEDALTAIRDRSYAGRHPELGKMINCQFCGHRHRENERTCVQKFAEKDGVVYGELVPPEGLTSLTKKQILGAKMFEKKRLRPHSNRWLPARSNKLAAVQRKKKDLTSDSV